MIRNYSRLGSAIPRRTLTLHHDAWQRVAPFVDPLYYALSGVGGKMGFWKCICQQQKDEHTELRLRLSICNDNEDAIGIAYFDAKLSLYGPLLCEPNSLQSPFPKNYCGPFVLGRCSEDKDCLLVPLSKDVNLKAVGFTHVKAKKIKLHPEVSVFVDYDEFDVDSADDDTTSQVSLVTRMPQRNLQNPVYTYGYTKDYRKVDSDDSLADEQLKARVKDRLTQARLASRVTNTVDVYTNQPGLASDNTVSILIRFHYQPGINLGK